MVPMDRIELSASPLPRECSTPELHGRTVGIYLSGAGEGNRTLTVSLEGFCSTIELHPRTYSKANSSKIKFGGGRRIRTFEAFATDLQSAPFGRSGIPPKENGMIMFIFHFVKSIQHFFLLKIVINCFKYISCLEKFTLFPPLAADILLPALLRFPDVLHQ